MKKISAHFIFSFVLLLFFASGLQAQTNPEDYFVGSWKIKAYGLPDGDQEMVLLFEKKEGKLTGGIADGSKVVIPFTKIEPGTNKVTAYFIAPEQQMEVYMTLEKQDDTNIKGSILDMFKVEGAKAK